MLTILDSLPGGLLDAHARHVHELLNGPTLIHLPGRREPPLFVSVLLHGNEPTGFQAVQRLLTRYLNDGLPRALSIFIGNVEAAREGARRLEHQPDYNRIWLPGDTPEHKMTRQVLDEMRRRSVFASIDIHNNTGINPHYACVNRIDHRFFHLASLFNRTIVYFTKPEGVQTSAFAALCPAVTLECGQPGQAHSVQHALDYLDACLHLAEIPDKAVPPHDIDLFHTVAVVKVPADVSFSFIREDTDIRFVDDLDHLNFRELPVNTLVGWVRPGSHAHVEARDEVGRDVTARYFAVQEGELRTLQPVMPSMLTLNEVVIRQDCLCYFMERLEILPDGNVVTREVSESSA